MPITIAVDAMGADRAPRPEIEGAILAARQYDVKVLLVGHQEVVRAELEFVFVKRLEEVLDAALERSPFVTLPRPTVPPVEPGLRAA